MPDPKDLSTLPGHVIRRLHQQSTAVYSEQTKAAGFDLTSVQYAALSALAADPGLDQAQLAKRIAYDRATIGGVIQRLERKGLVTRARHATDRRAFEVRLTGEGAALLDRLTPVVETAQADILGGLNATERDRLLVLMRKAVGDD